MSSDCHLGDLGLINLAEGPRNLACTVDLTGYLPAAEALAANMLSSELFTELFGLQALCKPVLISECLWDCLDEYFSIYSLFSNFPSVCF